MAHDIEQGRNAIRYFIEYFKCKLAAETAYHKLLRKSIPAAFPTSLPVLTRNSASATHYNSSSSGLVELKVGRLKEPDTSNLAHITDLCEWIRDTIEVLQQLLKTHTEESQRSLKTFWTRHTEITNLMEVIEKSEQDHMLAFHSNPNNPNNPYNNNNPLITL